MDLSIIIPSKDRQKILTTTLNKAYKAIENLDAEIIIINDSKSAAVTISPHVKDKVRVLDNTKSGVASARNLGASEAKSELLLFMDDDMWISEENILVNLDLHQKMDKCCINLNWVYPPELNEKISNTQFGRYLHYYGFTSLKGWCRGLMWNDTELFLINGITSQYLSILKKDFLAVGGYNNAFPYAGFEDHEFSKRLQEHGIQPYIYPLSMLYHNEADRMDVESWLARKRRGGETRRVALEIGYKEVAIEYNPVKRQMYKVLVEAQPALQKALAIIPNLPAFDKIYFKILNLLLGTAIYEGYHKKTF